MPHLEQATVRPGDLVSVDTGDGAFGVAKVLAVDPDGVHCRLYVQRFADRPSIVDPEHLTLASMLDPQMPFSIGHIPLAHATFAGWAARIIRRDLAVEERELAGYRSWRDAEGGYF